MSDENTSDSAPDFVREWARSSQIPPCPGLKADGMCPYGYGATCCALLAASPVPEEQPNE